MDLVQLLSCWLAAFVILLICDYLWLGIAIKDLIIEDFKPYIKVEDNSVKVRLGVGLLAWAVISLGCVYFVSMQTNSILGTIALGAFFGFILYACYDLTNYTFFVNYSLRFVIIDILWGSFVCSLVSLGGFMVRKILFGI